MAQYLKMSDKVRVRAGKDRGKEGKIIQILPEDHMVVVEGVNKMFKHIRAPKKGDKGQRIEFAAPLDYSKVVLVCPKCSKPTRTGMKVDNDKKRRVCKKCKEIID